MIKLNPDERNLLNAIMLGLVNASSREHTQKQLDRCVEHASPLSKPLLETLNIYISSLPDGSLNDNILGEIAEKLRTDGEGQLSSSLSWALSFEDPRHKAERKRIKCAHCGK